MVAGSERDQAASGTRDRRNVQEGMVMRKDNPHLKQLVDEFYTHAGAKMLRQKVDRYFDDPGGGSLKPCVVRAGQLQRRANPHRGPSQTSGIGKPEPECLV